MWTRFGPFREVRALLSDPWRYRRPISGSQFLVGMAFCAGRQPGPAILTLGKDEIREGRDRSCEKWHSRSAIGWLFSHRNPPAANKRVALAPVGLLAGNERKAIHVLEAEPLPTSLEIGIDFRALGFVQRKLREAAHWDRGAPPCTAHWMSCSRRTPRGRWRPAARWACR